MKLKKKKNKKELQREISFLKRDLVQIRLAEELRKAQEYQIKTMFDALGVKPAFWAGW